MDKILFLLTLFFVGCNASTNKTNDVELSTGDKKVIEEPTAKQPAFSVTVTQNDKTVLTYTNDATSSTTVLYKEHLSVNLNHSKHSLTVDVQATATGTYPIKLPAGIAEKSTASIMLIPEANDFKYSLNPISGTVNITQLTDAVCSGNFETAGKTPDGKGYTLNGTFKNIAVKQIK